jgi:error-prone DNA polymerase
VQHRGPKQRDMKREPLPCPTPSRNGQPRLTQRVRRQIRHELEVIARLDLAGYFLTVWDIVRFARRRGILLQGRGSAANSCVCYCLGITAVDPIKFELLFERFLSEERGGAPDIDLDIEHEQREEVLQYIYCRYGRGHAAMVCEAITYRGRSAVRDAARVLGFSTDVADRLAAEAERREAAEAAAALEDGGLVACGLDPASSRVRALVHVVRGLDQLPRHRSIHVGGFVLTEGPLSRVVPIEPAAMPDRTVIQWDKDDLEFTGLIKIDLLGLGMLTCLAKAIRYIRETRGVAIDLAQLPASDPRVYKMIQTADTVGVFQIESRAQMNSLPRLKPERFYDLVVQVALIRPGPIQGDMVHPYVRRRRGEEPVTYLHPDLEPILHRTLGVPLFQEQGMKVAVAMAGFTPGQADALRRAMGFKRSKEAMALIEPALRQGMTRRDISQDVQDQIVKQLTAFANYGFPESHSASFALLVYASAYLKCYYAPEFFCALLNSQPMGFYAPGTLVHDARRHGVDVRPVDLAYSSWDCTLEVGDGVPSVADRSETREPLAPGSRHLPRTTSPAVVSSRPPRAGARVSSPSAGAKRVSPDASGERDMKRGVPTAPDRTRGTKRGVGAVPDRPALRIGLRFIRGLGSKAEEKLKAAWEAGGPFWSVEDVVRRSGLGLPALKMLAEAGAFQTLWGPGRRSALWEVLARLAQKPLAQVESTREPKLREMRKVELVAADYTTTGLCTHGHPMEYLRAALRARGVLSAEELRDVRSGRHVKVAGVVICRQRPGTAKGVCFITLEDETGFSNFVVYADLFQRCRKTIVRSPVLLIEGIAQNEQDVVNVQARRIAAIEPQAGAEVIESHDFH